MSHDEGFERERIEPEEPSSPEHSTDEPSVDEVRRKLLRSTAVLGGAFMAGQVPYASPAVKSFFGTREAWAQMSPTPVNPAVMVTQPTNLPIVIVTNAQVNPILASALSDAPTAEGTFTVENTGDVTVVFHPPMITGAGAGDFSIVGAEVGMEAKMAPFELQPSEVATITVLFTCNTEGALSEATIELDIKTLEGAPVPADEVLVSGKCGTLDCMLMCPDDSETCFDGEGFSIEVDEIEPNFETFFVANTGTLPLNVASVEIQNGDFLTLTPTTGVVQPGDKLEQRIACKDGLIVIKNDLIEDPTIVVTAESADLVDGAPVPVECPPGDVKDKCRPSLDT